MGYALSRRAQTTIMSPEEAIVCRALNNYCFEPALCSADDWCSIVMLYSRYRTYFAGRDDCPPHLFLGHRAFGVALRRVFSIAAERKVQKRWKGKLTWGYSFIQGPGSIKVSNRPGRRPKEVQDAAIAATPTPAA